MSGPHRLVRQAERSFPVRVRISVPHEGFGSQLRIMHAWLDETCGPAGWAVALSGQSGGVNDAIAFYFVDVGFAQAFVTRFCCGHRVEAANGAFVPRRGPPPLRRGAAAHKTP